MISDYMYAIFSADVYQSNNVSLPNGWRMYLSSQSSGPGYAGVAYINDSTGEVVIAHRGTDDGIDWIPSNLQLYVDQTPSQFADAQAFITQVKNQLILENRPTNQITYTGHSLGGALAQMSVAWEYLNGVNTKAVVFDSPGVTLQMLQDAVGASFSTPEALDLKNYLVSPNLVNTLNAHFADIVRVYPVYNVNNNSVNGTLLDDYTNYTLQQHGIMGILSQFDSLTGQPFVSSIPTFWPAGAGYNDFFLSYDANPHYWEIYFAANNITGQARLDFINANLGGVHDVPGSLAGVSITGDASDNYIWGTTNSQDTVNAGSGNDKILGYGGVDILSGQDGNDILDGGTGNDILNGGAGNDEYDFALGNFGNDTVIDSDGQGKLVFGGKSIPTTSAKYVGNGLYSLYDLATHMYYSFQGLKADGSNATTLAEIVNLKISARDISTPVDNNNSVTINNFHNGDYINNIGIQL